MAITESVAGYGLLLAGRSGRRFVGPRSGLALKSLGRCGPLASTERSQKWIAGRGWSPSVAAGFPRIASLHQRRSAAINLSFIVRRSAGSLLASLLGAPATSVWADDFSTSALSIDGPPSLASPELVGGNINVVAGIDPSTGAARTSVVFAMPAARGAAQPTLELEYRSTLAVGIAGTRVDAFASRSRAQGCGCLPQIFR